MDAWAKISILAGRLKGLELTKQVDQLISVCRLQVPEHGCYVGYIF